MGLAFSLLFSAFVPGFAEEPNPYQANITRGRAFLFARLKDQNEPGYLGLGVMALVKTAPIENGVRKKEPALDDLVDRFAQLVEAREQAFAAQDGTYALAVAISCLIADDPARHDRILRRLVARLVASQLPAGSWSYPSGAPANGDTSQTQYVALALWDAARAGHRVPPRVWDSALDWQIRTQDGKGGGGPGGFVYHPVKVSDDGRPIDQGNETATMGVAGLSTLLICQGQLPGLGRGADGKAALPLDALIRPVADGPEQAPFAPKVTADQARGAVARAEAWVARNSAFRDPFKDLHKVNYYLYGFERVAVLVKATGVKSPISAIDWYRVGGDYLARTQKPDGSWSMGAHWNEAADTAFALMFLGRVTERKPPPKVEVIPRGRAIGGEGGLPAADGAPGKTAFEQQWERFKSQPMTSIDELVRIIAEQDVVAVPIAENRPLSPQEVKEIVQSAAGDPSKLYQWAYDKRSEARTLALALLAKTRNVRHAPILIGALNDADAKVYNAARDGLRYLSRNVEAFGLPEADKRNPESVKAGAERAKDWFRGLKIESSARQEFGPVGR